MRHIIIASQTDRRSSPFTHLEPAARRRSEVRTSHNSAAPTGIFEESSLGTLNGMGDGFDLIYFFVFFFDHDKRRTRE